MKKMMVVLALALSGAAGAAPRRVVVASGDCKDAELSSQTKAFYTALMARPGEDVLSAAAFTERLFPMPSGSFEDIKRQLDAAQGQFYEARYARAAQGLEEVLKQVARLPVGEARWKLYVEAQLLQALNSRAMNRVKESDDAFRNVLRLDAQYTLDPDQYTPSTRQAFEKLRKELVKAKKVKLSVKSTLPASEVFLDGRSMGQTPLSLEVPAGTYELALKNGEAVSFPRQIPVQGEETPVLVDLAYEGSISASPFPCLASGDDDDKVLSHAVRMGGTLGVEEVIVVRLERASSGPKWLAATVLNVEGGQKLREGGFKTQGLDAPAESLTALVDYVTTGKTQPSVVVLSSNIQPPWAAAAEPSASAADDTKEAKSGSVRPLRAVSYVVLGVGVASLAGAGVVRIAAEPDWQALQPHINANNKVDANDTVGKEILGRLGQKANILNGLLIGSGAALATGAVLYLLSPEPPPVSVGVTATPNGAGASLSGTF
ncbi:PEGA domain-containing protein [Archangium violaceum]|uniref:PEGA domain-containing protein n=1 Tax=Archangium violaceum TaxID=83451 RepID=UPI00194EACCB|nr:PEGA domain-containing protein [Archangium violaceum]QRN98106.1 PEGA domain-containing protein [Archangium violaceum]